MRLEEPNAVQLFGSLDCLFMPNSICAQLHSIHQEVRLSEVMKAAKRWFALESNDSSKKADNWVDSQVLQKGKFSR